MLAELGLDAPIVEVRELLSMAAYAPSLVSPRSPCRLRRKQQDRKPRQRGQNVAFDGLPSVVSP